MNTSVIDTIYRSEDITQRLNSNSVTINFLLNENKKLEDTLSRIGELHLDQEQIWDDWLDQIDVILKDNFENLSIRNKDFATLYARIDKKGNINWEVIANTDNSLTLRRISVSKVNLPPQRRPAWEKILTYGHIHSLYSTIEL